MQDGEPGLGNVIDDAYTQKIESPLYEPKGDKPHISELFDDSVTKKLIDEIVANSVISDEEKLFLIK